MWLVYHNAEYTQGSIERNVKKCGIFKKRVIRKTEFLVYGIINAGNAGNRSLAQNSTYSFSNPPNSVYSIFEDVVNPKVAIERVDWERRQKILE